MSEPSLWLCSTARGCCSFVSKKNALKIAMFTGVYSKNFAPAAGHKGALRARALGQLDYPGRHHHPRQYVHRSRNPGRLPLFSYDRLSKGPAVRTLVRPQKGWSLPTGSCPYPACEETCVHYCCACTMVKVGSQADSRSVLYPGTSCRGRARGNVTCTTLREVFLARTT